MFTKAELETATRHMKAEVKQTIRILYFIRKRSIELISVRYAVNIYTHFCNCISLDRGGVGAK